MKCFLIDRLIYLMKIYNLDKSHRYRKNMQVTGKQKGDSVLPKIRSQQKIHTASERKSTDQDKTLMNRPLSNNCRTRSLRAFTAKTVKYESAGNTYNRKFEEIQKQTFLVDRELKTVEDEIKTLRQVIGASKKEPNFSRLNESTASYLTKITTRKNISLDQGTIKTELKNLETKILNYRNKIDTHLEKNKVIHQQIDSFRKEISTLKNVNYQLEVSYKLTSQKYDEQMQLSKRLDTEISQKTQLTHRKKVENMHQKTQMIKQYDVILKTLDKQLNTQRQPNETGKSEFYLTDIADPRIEYETVIKSDQKSARQIISGEKKPKISEIQEKLKNYERQFEQLKRKVGSSNIEQLTKKFTEEYQKNFHQYNFINEMYKEYEDTNNEQFELLQKKNELLKELKGEKSSCKIQEVQELKSKIQKINQMKVKIKQDMKTYERLATEMKVYLTQFQMLLPQSQQSNLHERIHEKPVSSRLYEIYEKYSQQFWFANQQKGREKRISKNSLTHHKQTLDDLIEELQKQRQNLKDNRLLTRQELQQNTTQLKAKKTEGSLHQKYKIKKELEKTKNEKTKRSSQ